LLAFADSQNVGGLVLGWPVNMDGSRGPRCDSVRDFAHALLKIRDIPIVFQDERLSTKAVESAMVAADMTRAKRAERRDALAACWILQSFLDYLHDHHITADT
jgi:putative Holliday junction resolvase